MAELIEIRVRGEATQRVGDGAIFGRGRSADVAIPGSGVSRKHLQLHLRHEGWTLTDLGSANGLYGPDGKTDSLLLPPGITAFSLGPPDAGCTVEALVTGSAAAATGPEVVDELSMAPTRQVARTDGAVGAVAGAAAEQGRPYAPAIQGFAGSAAVGAPHAPAHDPGRGNGASVLAQGLNVVVDGGLVILDDASLSLTGGTMTAIVGPSGCGKSTLANLLSGRSQPTSGSVTIGAEPMTAEVRKRIGVVPQYDAVHERLTVRQSLAAAAKLRLTSGTPKAAIDEAVARTASTLGLEQRLDTRISKLSGGQKKRVSVGYELVSSPAMIVLDEPTSGLDPGLEQELIMELRGLADRGTTTIVVTHSTEAAERADVVVVMSPGGHIAFVGPPAQVLEHFGAHDWASIFGRLTAADATRWAAYFSGTDAYQRHVATPPPPSGFVGAVAHQRSWFNDFSVMTGRYLRSILADPRSLLLLAAQAPILGVLFALVLSTNVFGTSLRPSTAAREFVLAAVLAMVWIGASNSIREIVKERKTFLRERAVGVSASSLVASRWLVLALITTLQATILYATAASRQRTPLDEGVLFGSGRLELIAALAAIGLASVGIGLVLSGLVKDSSKAMALLPIVLIPIVLFSGLLIPTSGKLGLEQISYVNPVMWPSSAAAVTSDVLAKEGCNPTGIEAQIQQALLGRTISCSNTRWQTTASTQAVNFGLSALVIMALLGLSFWVTDRSTREIRV